MINLLPPDLKAEYHYARMNTRLRHWLMGALTGLAGLVVLATFGLLYTSHNVTTYQQIVANDNASLATQDVANTTQDISAMSDNLTLMLKVLNKEVLWGDLLKQIATVTPSNVILTSLSISQTENAIDITASSTNYASGTQLYTNLNDPANKVFSKADLQSISCANPTSTGDSSGLAGGAYNSGSGGSNNSSSSSGSTGKYPCNVSIRGLFVQNSPFLFTSSGKVAK